MPTRGLPLAIALTVGFAGVAFGVVFHVFVAAQLQGTAEFAGSLEPYAWKAAVLGFLVAAVIYGVGKLLNRSKQPDLLE